MTSEELEQNIVLSSRKRRIAAFIIDHFLMTFIMVLIIFLTLGRDFIKESNGTMPPMSMALMIPGFLLYFAKDVVKGISVGKWIMGIMIRDEREPGEIPSFGRLLLRNLFIIIWPVEFIVLALNKNKQRLGDSIARTIVVKNPVKAKKISRILALAGIVMAFSTFMFFFMCAAVKNSEAYNVAIKEIEKNEEIIIKTGGIKGYG